MYNTVTVGKYEIQIHNDECITIYTDNYEVYLDNTTKEDIVEIKKIDSFGENNE
jgi:hypothetical protein|tara:strand:+ start:375 stop:536 length:162 start_codon:yes stop_codon:yes gene_type:complete